MFKTSLENRWRTLFTWHKVDKREELSDVTWSLKFKFESNIIPRSLAEDTGFNSWPRKGTVTSGRWDRSCLYWLSLLTAFTDASAEVGLVGVPLCDLFNTNKLLLDNIEIKIKIDLNSKEEANNCKLKIMSSTLTRRTARVTDSTKLEHVSIMQGRAGQKALLQSTP